MNPNIEQKKSLPPKKNTFADIGWDDYFDLPDPSDQKLADVIRKEEQNVDSIFGDLFSDERRR